MEYGLVKQLESKNLVWINAHEFVKIGSDLKDARNLRDAWFYVLGRPGWAPGVKTVEAGPAESVAPQTACS